MFEKLIGLFAGLSAAKKEAACLLALVLACLLLFFGVVFCGQSVSRVVNLVNQDYLFRYVTICPPSNYDVALPWMKVAYYLFTGGLWREGHLPLWNPNGGAGYPLLGEVQAIALSPWMIFYTIWPSVQMHNYVLVLQQILGTLGMYLAARALGLQRYSSLFAALAQLFCAHQLWRQELQMNYYFYPLIIWSFLRFYQTRKISWAFWAGVFCAATITSGDAQVSLLCIGTAGFFLVMCGLLDESEKRIQFKLLGLAGLSLAGINAFCLASPVFLSFVEFVKYGDLSKHHRFYKIGLAAPWQSLLYSVVHPGFGGASLYVGCLTLPLAALSLFALKAKKPYYLSVLITVIVAFMGASRTGIFPLFDKVFDLMGCSRFEGMEPYVVFLCFLLAFGLEQLLSEESRISKTIVFIAACVVAGLTPFLLNLNHFDLQQYSFDTHIEHFGFNKKWWRTDAIILTAVALASLATLRFRKRAVWLFVFATASLTFLSEAGVCATALPPQPKFKYKSFEPLTFLSSQKNSRIVPIGFELLHPNTNYVYRIASLASHGPVSPLRLQTFINAAGGKADPFNAVFPKSTFNQLLDLASIKYLVSLQPVRDIRDPYSQGCETEGLVTFKGTDELRLLSAKVEYDNINNEVGGYLDWSIKEGVGEKYNYLIAINDDSGRTYWTGGPYYVKRRTSAYGFSPPFNFSHADLPGLVTANLPEGVNFSVCIYVQTADLKPIEPILGRGTFKFKNKAIVLGCFKKQTLPASEKRRFKLISETPATYIRVYENQHALPPAYMVHGLIETSETSLGMLALQEIRKDSFDPRQKAVVEKSGLKVSASPGGVDEVRLTRPDNNTVLVDVDAKADGLLVLTDQFYPGWHVVVDGTERELVRANYLFKAVEIPQGKHKVVFYYLPTYFLPGLALIVLCLAGNLVAFMLLSRRSKTAAVAVSPSPPAGEAA